MKMILCLFICFPLAIFAQKEKGLKFEEGLSWEQILAKAKAENKYVFVDCFTTWCGPCKRMDIETYPDDSIGQLMNDKFISVKVQMDKTKKDNDTIRNWYTQAESLEKKYKIFSYPTYLFFSPQGELVHKDVGYKKRHEFIETAQVAITPGIKYNDPYKEYNGLIENYRNGKKEYEKMPYMVKVAKEVYDWKLVDTLTKDYSNYLLNLKNEELFTKENIPFIAAMDSKMLKGTYFQMFYRDGKRIDAIMNKIGYSQTVIDRIIQEEEVREFFKSEKNKIEPNWKQLATTVTNKYAFNYSERNVLAAKIKWYENKQDIANYTRHFITQVEKNWQDTTEEKTDLWLNQVAYVNIFEKSNDKNQIKSAIKWMEGVVRRSARINAGWNAATIDTYANLLYKAGRINEATSWELVALRIATETQDKSNIAMYQDVINRMKEGQPTWPIKPVLDSTAIDHWVKLGDNSNLAISNDGKYFTYLIDNYPYQSATLVIESLDQKWKKEFPGGSQAIFSADNKKAVFRINDTLCFLQLGGDNPKYIPFLNSYKIPKSGKGEWIAYALKNDGKELILHNLLTGNERHFDSVEDFSFDDQGNVLLLKTHGVYNNTVTTNLQWVNLRDGVVTLIWSIEGNIHGPQLSSYNLDAAGTQLTFAIKLFQDNRITYSIWYYKVGMDKAVMKANDLSPGIETGLTIGTAAPQFSKDGRYIFFNLRQINNSQLDLGAVSLDIWSYRDTLLQSAQLKRVQQGSIPKTFVAVINTLGDRVVRIERDYEWAKEYPTKGDFIVVAYNTSAYDGDRFWLNEVDTYFLVSLKDGSRTLLKTKGHPAISFSPGGHYLVYSDFDSRNHYFCYDLQSGKTQNISAAVPGHLLSTVDEYLTSGKKSPDTLSTPVGIAAWEKDDEWLLVYDNYDIWQLDPTGNKKAANITNGYGRRHDIKFRLPGVQTLKIDDNGPLLLTAYNTVSKYNGFFRIELDKKGDPEILTMGPYTYYHSSRAVFPGNGFEFDWSPLEPVKGKNVNIWIVKREAAIGARNYFSTFDFKNYQQLTNLQPNVEYNWLRTELVKWKQTDGTLGQGILYKPENFDPKRKYPVITLCYEQFSHRLYEYPIPDFTRSTVNIPWFVSRGYLVFTPDIYYVKGEEGPSALNSVESAARYLASLPYVNGKKMGLNGHSFGGYETNYILSHSNIFAAVIEGAGSSDWISSSLQLRGDGGSRLEIYEPKMPYNLWQKPEIYIEASPVFRANRITSPLLIFHAIGDPAVPWEQAVELFVSLRRLEKPTWMLQYDGEHHGNWSTPAAKDYTIRANQFFDHYLKDAPAPRWMTQGIPATLKMVERRLELDPSGNCGKDCKVCKKWNEKMKKDSIGTMKEIEQRKIEEYWQ